MLRSFARLAHVLRGVVGLAEQQIRLRAQIIIYGRKKRIGPQLEMAMAAFDVIEGFFRFFHAQSQHDAAVHDQTVLAPTGRVLRVVDQLIENL